MKNSVFKTSLLVVALFGSLVSFAQDFQGKAYYQTKTTMDLDQWGVQEMSPDRKKRMEERMRRLGKLIPTYRVILSDAFFLLSTPQSRGFLRDLLNSSSLTCRRRRNLTRLNSIELSG